MLSSRDGPDGAEVRDGSQHRRCLIQVQSSTPLSLAKGRFLEGAFKVSSSPFSPVVSLQSHSHFVPSLTPPPPPPPPSFRSQSRGVLVVKPNQEFEGILELLPK